MTLTRIYFHLVIVFVIVIIIVIKSKILTKHISCECKYKFDGRKCNSNQKWNKDKRQCECKNHHICEKDYIWNPATCSCKNGKYLARIINDSVIACDKIMDAVVTKTVTINFSEKNIVCETKAFCILLAFLLITNALLIAVSTYCYLIKYRAKQKHLLLFHVTNNKWTI